MKKILMIAFVALATSLCLTGCGKDNDNDKASMENTRWSGSTSIDMGQMMMAAMSMQGVDIPATVQNLLNGKLNISVNILVDYKDASNGTMNAEFVVPDNVNTILSTISTLMPNLPISEWEEMIAELQDENLNAAFTYTFDGKKGVMTMIAGDDEDYDEEYPDEEYPDEEEEDTTINFSRNGSTLTLEVDDAEAAEMFGSSNIVLTLVD